MWFCYEKNTIKWTSCVYYEESFKNPLNNIIRSKIIKVPDDCIDSSGKPILKNNVTDNREI